MSFSQPQTAGSQVAFNGRLDGMLSVITTRGTSTPDQSNTRLIAEVTAVLSNSNPSEPRLTLNFFNRESNLVITLDAKWGGTPRVIQASISSTTLGGDGGTTRPLFSSRFVQNDDVLQPANALHAQALRALDALGAALRDTQFAPVSATLLFPPPPAPASDLQVRATRDWVLFHRRRTKTCHAEPLVLVVPPRRYQLWHGRAANADLLQRAIEALRSGARFDPQSVAFQRVAIVEFSPGVQTLASSPQGILDDWKQVPPGQQLLYAGIASGEEAEQEGADLARARLQQVTDVVSSVSSPTSNTTVEVLDRVHPDLAVPDVDGIVVAFTQLQTTCATVFSTRSLERVVALLANNNLPSAIKLGTELGVVLFKKDTTDVVGDGLDRVRDAWQAGGFGGRALQSIAVLQEGDNTLTNELASKQAVTIEAPLGQGTAPRVMRVAAETPRCPVLVFIEPQEAPVRRALLVYGNFDIENGSLSVDQPPNIPFKLEFREDAPQGTVLQNYLAGLGPNRPVMVVMLTTPGQLDDGADERLRAVTAGIVKPNGFREFAKARSQRLADDLRRNGFNPDDFDDVIVFSRLNLQGPND